MERSDFLFGVGAVIGGALLTIIIEWLRGWLERKQRRADRRDEFQRESLEHLQRALLQLARCAAQTHMVIQAEQRISTELDETQRLTSVEVSVYAVRITDESVGNLVQEFQQAVRNITAADSNSNHAILTEELVTSLDAANTRIGECLRKL